MFEGLRFNHWKASEDDSGIVTLALDRADSSVNAISGGVLDELGQIVERLAIENPAGVIIHSAKPAGFAVGADITEFKDYARQGAVLENIENGQLIF
jgi:3-hydroxyacyl-CoA dehydrogenase/enoyl-CoA hydratase/3-hydroxybutyryl-CoA epimerase